MDPKFDDNRALAALAHSIELLKSACKHPEKEVLSRCRADDSAVRKFIVVTDEHWPAHSSVGALTEQHKMQDNGPTPNASNLNAILETLRRSRSGDPDSKLTMDRLNSD